MGKPRLTTDWDALVTSAPINSQAAKDAAAKGTAFAPRKKIYQDWDAHSHAPLPTRPPDHPGALDLTGERFGKLTVIGLSVLKRAARARWVVRCACGAYEHRTTRALRITNSPHLECEECHYVTQIKAGRGGVAFPKQTVRT